MGYLGKETREAVVVFIQAMIVRNRNIKVKDVLKALNEDARFSQLKLKWVNVNQYYQKIKAGKLATQGTKNSKVDEKDAGPKGGALASIPGRLRELADEIQGILDEQRKKAEELFL